MQQKHNGPVGREGYGAAPVSRAAAAEPRWGGAKGLVLPARCNAGRWQLILTRGYGVTQPHTLNGVVAADVSSNDSVFEWASMGCVLPQAVFFHVSTPQAPNQPRKPSLP